MSEMERLIREVRQLRYDVDRERLRLRDPEAAMSIRELWEVRERKKCGASLWPTPVE